MIVRIGAMGGMIAAAAMSVTAPAVAAPQPSAAIEALVDRFDAARAAFDPDALAATLADDYVEISPVGTVDSRAEVLGFYAPDKRHPAPPMRHDERVVRVSSNTASVTERKAITLPNGTVRAIRVGYVARRTGNGWRLVSAQYTPIPPAR
ncbi:nuclear transport factor 2 family protein [uncultured Sphingomonas sp.]|uniref:nuclear transport factor 2 family protein n=1 Tax=uncultured Sphingomonas sp. TaxID=158754 RepID=UPI0025FCBC86|nr:nuclear transport factor 2 family protein [uncultured Sphingomonas sp.]